MLLAAVNKCYSPFLKCKLMKLFALIWLYRAIQKNANLNDQIIQCAHLKIWMYQYFNILMIIGCHSEHFILN